MKTWKQRIAEAEKNGEFTDEDKQRAQSFLSCAVGEKFPKEVRRDIIPERLEELGMQFWQAVIYDAIPKARGIYEEIQKA